jgi:Zn ribbon nucleic-acid-binding protein
MVNTVEFVEFIDCGYIETGNLMHFRLDCSTKSKKIVDEEETEEAKDTETETQTIQIQI